ncbi:hypothetical protein FRC10_007533 [Ceratobasidium sp. 414]|nr:hypothetical protein FRC10_007533 [Ceratobasidium sp. 414]
MSLSTTRSRRSNAGNRWAEALAAAQLENGDVPDPDAEVSGEEFVGREEEDVFESDFESTDEEEYAKEGVQDEEGQVMMEERAERRAARARASKSVAAPVQRILERAAKGEPVKRKKKAVVKQDSGKCMDKNSGDSVMWDATRQSRRASTVKHKTLVRERLKDAEERKAHAVKRPRKVIVTKTQDELIAEALELEEKNTKSLKEFLVKEEEKRAAARRVVRVKINGPLVRWVSRAEDVRVKIEGGAGSGNTGAIVAAAGTHPTLNSGAARVTPVGASNGPTLSPANGSSQQHARSPLSQSITPLPQPQRENTPVQGSGLQSTSQPAPRPSISTTSTSVSSQPERASTTPAPSTSGQRMQVYVEIPRRSISGSQHPRPSSSSQPLPSISISEPPSGSVPKGSKLSQPLPASLSLVRASSLARSISGCSVKSASPVDTLNPTRPNMIRQASVSSTSSNKSRMVMYVELPPPKSGRARVLASTAANPAEGKPKAQEATHKPAVSRVQNIDRDIFPPGGPNFAIVLPQRRSSTAFHKKERQARNYVVVELSGKERASFGARMRAVFGDHADWSEVLMNGAKSNGARTTPICAITGLDAPYRDPRTGIPYANAYAYKTLTRLLQHEFVWSQEKGCYVGDEGRNAARGVPWNWAIAATERA